MSDLENDDVDATMMGLLMIFLVWTLCASFCSFTILYLIYKMKLKNGHILLIWTMSIFQLLYDTTLFFAAINVGSKAIFFAANMAQEIGGISCSLTSNFMAFIAYYVVKYTKSVDVYRYYPIILAVVLIPSLVNSILYFVSCFAPYFYLRHIAQLYVYYVIRLVSIGVNFIVSIATAWQIHKMSASAVDMPITPHEKAIRTLATRLMYYPIVQAISRSAVSWYEIKYGFTFSPHSGDGQNKFIAMCCFALLTPVASFGYLAIFLLMQPNAYDCLRCTIFCRAYVPPSQITSANLLKNNLTNNNSKGVRRQLRNVVGGVNQNENIDYSYSHNSLVSDSEYNNNNSIQHVINTIIRTSTYNGEAVDIQSNADSEESLRDKFDEELWLLVEGSGPDYDDGGEAPSHYSQISSPSLLPRWTSTNSYTLNERLLGTPPPQSISTQQVA